MCTIINYEWWGGKEEEEERWKGPGGVNQSIVQFIRGVVQELPNTIMRLKVCATTLKMSMTNPSGVTAHFLRGLQS